MAGLVAAFVLGSLAGGMLFSDTQPRSFLKALRCDQRCLKLNELTGLITSVGIARLPGWIPDVVFESDRCVAIDHPFGTRADFHFVLFPKRDIRNVAELDSIDQAYVMDCFAVVRAIVQERGIERYRLYTNGPERQEIAYLHFHLVP